MIVNILTDKNSWFQDYAQEFVDQATGMGHNVNYVIDQNNIIEGDILFALGFYKILKKIHLVKNKNNIVVHESDLPSGKGWSPFSWQILEGKNDIVFTLFEMNEKVDSGVIYMKETLSLEGHELVEELRVLQARKKIDMSLRFLAHYPKILSQGKEQSGPETFYDRRGKESSQLDVNKTIAEQFNLLRIVDNEAYPAFFELHGHHYKITVEKQ